MQTIPLSYTPVDRTKLDNVLKKYEGQPHTKMVTEFENKLSAITGAKYVVALNSGTAAIHLGLKILGVKEGDEVMVPTFTFVASIMPLLYIGAKPIFVDSERDTWNMDPALLEQGIKDRLAAGIKPKAIILVHGYGMPAKINEIQAIATQYGIALFEDAAESLGSAYNGSHPGIFGEAGVLSFNNNKIITTYGGGALLTGNETLYRKAIFLAEQAREPKPFYEHHEIGYNYRMGSLNAASGLARIDDLASIVNKRRKIHAFYKAALQPAGIRFLEDTPDTRSNHWLTAIILDKAGSAAPTLEKLKKAGIEARFLWSPMHRQAVFSPSKAFLSGACEDLFSRGISLPSSPEMNENDLQRVVSNVLKGVFE